MEQLHFITKLLDIKDPNIQILDIINKDTHKEIIAKLDYEAPSCPDCGSLMKKYDFQKPSKIPYLETTGMPSRILLRKRRFKCYHPQLFTPNLKTIQNPCLSLDPGWFLFSPNG
ncbi:transposase family protein, partial [Streptococcus pneumoniae]|uniref:transposase family protein n=1 Tax=Streptococcus pneumoniae TaxID=1313 RepID=UPI000A90C8E6